MLDFANESDARGVDQGAPCETLTSSGATRAREVRGDLAGQPHVRNP